MDTIIKVKNLSKTIGTNEILRNVSFDIKEGSINGLLGPNGSGKTTMIRLLNGVIIPTEGEIEVMGYSPSTDGATIRQGSGIVTETTNLYHEMSAWDNLMFFSEMYGIHNPKRAEELLRHFHMWEHKDEAVGSFSTGMKKRVALVKALLPSPKLLFLDEPTNGLDPEGIQMVLLYLKELNKKEKITIIICSHVLQQLDGFCDSYIFLKNGLLIESGERKEIEKRHISEIDLLVETGLLLELDTYNGFVCKQVGENQIQFKLKGVQEISTLLALILHDSWVHSCNVTNNSLDHLYFAVGGKQDE